MRSHFWCRSALILATTFVAIATWNRVHRDGRPGAQPADAKKPGLGGARAERLVLRGHHRRWLLPAGEPRATREPIDVPELRLEAIVFAVVAPVVHHVVEHV